VFGREYENLDIYNDSCLLCGHSYRGGDLMSTDIYIPMGIVLSHPGQFWFKTELNGSIEDAREAVFFDEDDPIDWDYVESIMKPVLLCKFGKRESWRVVEVFDHDLHISCAGQFRDWLLHWLEENGHKYTHI